MKRTTLNSQTQSWIFRLTWTILVFSISTPHVAKGQPYSPEVQSLDNPISEAYLKKNLKRSHPRLIIQRKEVRQLREKVKSDPVVKNMYAAIRLNSEEILKEPLLERKQIGRRLLSVSREMLYRMNILGMRYLVEEESLILDRIHDEILAVCAFSDWNPSHYLDVAEMSMAVALGLDWAYKDLPKETRSIALKTLVEKGIKPSYNPDGNVGWIKGTNNWNQVCHGGMIAASLMVAETHPELAAQTLHRALEGIPHALAVYGPDGAYPEGSTYWGYGTSFSALTASMLESALGTDFGLYEYPAFKESAVFRVMCNAPSGMYYNFADCGDRRSERGDLTLAWFGIKSGNATYFERERFLADPGGMGKLERHAGAGLVWLSRFSSDGASPLPSVYKAEGDNPIVIFRESSGTPNGFYLGGKGGRGTVNHGNMDAGSFIFELNGVRWVIDPGNQSYHALEKTGFNLWGRCQECERWTLITKNNYGHSTLTVNGELHVTDGMATLTALDDDPHSPKATFDLSPVFKGLLSSASRTFHKTSPASLMIEDKLRKNAHTQMVTWQLMTQADVEITPNGALLKQEGKSLKVENISHPQITFSVISLDPPPLELDRTLPGLKRLELRIPAYLLEEGENTIRVRLQG